jgi:Transposase
MVAAPAVLDRPVWCAPAKAPCPTCGRLGKRVRTGHRDVRTLAYRRVAWLRVTYGEYHARCGCRTTFRTSPAGVRPRARYDDTVRQAVLDRILGDGLNVEATLRSLNRDFLLDLSTGFVYDCLRDAVARSEMGEYRRRVLREFSGSLCVDELHLGRFTLLLATDPLRDMPVAFALVGANEGGHMRRFLSHLRSHGLLPRVVVTDGSGLYPALLAELWPHADHQLCVFHVLRDLHRAILDAVKRLRRAVRRRGRCGRKRRRGRPSKARRRRSRRRTQAAKAAFVFQHRHLIVKRRDRLTDRDHEHLSQMFRDLPELGPLRDFADALVRLLAAGQTEPQAWGRWRAVRANSTYQAIPELKRALAMLDQAKFGKVIAFVRTPAARRVRTNNHVERCNRKVRFWEKVRYKWRRRRTLVRFLVLALAHWWDQVLSAPRTPVADPLGGAETTPETRPRPMSEPRQPSRRKAA